MAMLWTTFTWVHICRTPIFWWISDANPTQGIAIETCHYIIGEGSLIVIERFLDFASHFICLQIFQIGFSTERLILSASKCSRYIFRGRSAQFFIALELAWKRVEFNVSESFKYFTPELLRKYLKKSIRNFKSLIAPWRGPLSKSLFWAFFLNSLRNPTIRKNQLSLRPPSCFSKRFA